MRQDLARILLQGVATLLPSWLGRVAEPLVSAPRTLGVPDLIQHIAIIGALAMFGGLTSLFLLFVFRLLFRRQVLAVVALTAFFTVTPVANAANPLLLLPFVFVTSLAMIVTLARVGLLAVIAAEFTAQLLNAAPSILPFGAWHAGLGATITAVVCALALYAFYRSLGGRSAFGTLTLEA